jgi:hypothetical protein
VRGEKYMGVCVVLQPSTPLHETHGEFSILKTNTEYVEKVTPPPPTHTHTNHHHHHFTLTLSVGVVTKIVAKPETLPAMKRDFNDALSSGWEVTIGRAAEKLAKHTACCCD